MIIKRESRTGANDLQTVYRPCRVDEIVGHETEKKVIRGNLDGGKTPHSYLFTGPPGCGKTTTARIVALGLNCEKGTSSKPCLECGSCKSVLNHNSLDVQEVNVGAYGNKADVLKIIEDLPTAPFNSRFKVIIMDEAHELTSAACEALLKIIEDGYSHVYFIFCTSKPHELKNEAFVGRCSGMRFGRISIVLIYDLLKNVAEYEGFEYKADILDYLAKESAGVPRQGLVWLKQVEDESSWTIQAAKQITGVFLDESDAQIIELSKALIKRDWVKAVSLYGKLNKLPAETVRVAVCGFFVGSLKRSRTLKDGIKYSKILDFLTIPIYESGKAGEHRFYNYMFKTIDILRGK